MAPKIPCDFCGILLSSFQQLKEHVLTYHSLDPSLIASTKNISSLVRLFDLFNGPFYTDVETRTISRLLAANPDQTIDVIPYKYLARYEFIYAAYTVPM